MKTKVDPVIVQIAVGPSGEVMALDRDGKVYCSFSSDPQAPLGGVDFVQGVGYQSELLPVRVKFRRWTDPAALDS